MGNQVTLTEFTQQRNSTLNLLFSRASYYAAFSMLIAFLSLSFNAWACSTAQWAPGASGSVAANGKPSVGGACGLEVTGTGYVQDNSPLTEGQFIGRFYWLPQLGGSGTTDIFVAYSDESGTELFSVKFNGTGIAVDATSATGGVSSYIPVSTGQWHLVEVAWEDNTTGNLWVDADATSEPSSASFTPGTGTVESVRLGAPNGFGGLTGTAYFDDYVSRRTQPIGGIVPGDANSDGLRDQADIDAIVQEFLFGTYSDGVTDCNLDGEVNSGDVNCVVAQF